MITRIARMNIRQLTLYVKKWGLLAGLDLTWYKYQSLLNSADPGIAKLIPLKCLKKLYQKEADSSNKCASS